MPTLSPPKSLILCVHAHQPVGNFGGVFEEAYEKSYRPFFEVLEKHPAVLMNCHLSGSLIDWVEKNRPDFFERLRTMQRRGQLEFLGGGYYEPIYGLIPKKDLVGQIRMMHAKLEDLFGVKPTGAWLTERVWDPHLVRVLTQLGVGYTILDDIHFDMARRPAKRKAGSSSGQEASVMGFYQARDGKHALDLFASMKQLRYLMPFHKPEETLEWIQKTPAGPEDVFVFADDCEKFGMWPGTYDWVYKEGWLDQLFSLLEKQQEIGLYTFSQFREKFKPKGFEKIPHASYSEMMEWSGGSFYNFFKKYPEARYMRDRMEHVSRILGSAPSSNGSTGEWTQAQHALYRAQCNCSYWHGVFGGLYLHHLRSAVFENLIQAENILERIVKKTGQKKSGVIQTEKMGSGLRWRIRQKGLVSYFNPSYGAALEELDSLPSCVNLMCNLQRHKEPYHQAVLQKKAETISNEPLSIHEMLGAKEKNLEAHLHYDPVRRLSFMDHFFEAELGLEDFRKSQYREAGDFVGTPYQARSPENEGPKKLVFYRTGAVKRGSRRFTLKVEKAVEPKGTSGFCVGYALTNRGSVPVSFIFGVEFNFSIGETEAMQGLEKKNIRQWVFHDSWRGFSIQLDFQEAATLLAAPVETVSESESGLEKTYQELGVLLQRPVSLKPGETQRSFVKLSVQSKGLE